MPEADLKALVLDKFEHGAEGGGEASLLEQKELAEVTRQRPAHLGVALEELCDYVKTGSMKGTYELNRGTPAGRAEDSSKGRPGLLT